MFAHDRKLRGRPKVRNKDLLSGLLIDDLGKDVVYRRRKKQTGENRNALINTVSVVLARC